MQLNKGDKLTMEVLSITPNYRKSGETALNLITCKDPEGGAINFEERALPAGTLFQISKQNSFEITTLGTPGKPHWIRFLGIGGVPVVNKECSIVTQVAFKGALEFVLTPGVFNDLGGIVEITPSSVLQLTEQFANGLIDIANRLKSPD